MNFIKVTTHGDLDFHGKEVVHLNVGNIVLIKEIEGSDMLDLQTEIITTDGRCFAVEECLETILQMIQGLKDDYKNHKQQVVNNVW